MRFRNQVNHDDLQESSSSQQWIRQAILAYHHDRSIKYLAHLSCLQTCQSSSSYSPSICLAALSPYGHASARPCKQFSISSYPFFAAKPTLTLKYSIDSSTIVKRENCFFISLVPQSNSHILSTLPYIRPFRSSRSVGYSVWNQPEWKKYFCWYKTYLYHLITLHLMIASTSPLITCHPVSGDDPANPSSICTTNIATPSHPPPTDFF